MALNVKDIKDSGLLELYVLGDISQEERSMVRTALIKFPELHKDIREIEFSLLQYAKLHSVEPSAGLKDNIIKELSQSNVATNKLDSNSASSASMSRRNYFIPLIFSLLAALGLLAWTIFQNGERKKIESQYQKDQIICDSLLQVNQVKDQLFIALSDPGNRIIEVDPTEKYSGTNLYVHYNQATQKNYIQLVDLPAINANQSYQLWSLKETGDPIPLDVFQGDEKIFEFTFEEGTNAYAITIEPRGGQTSPTLENLIGVIPLA